MASRSLHDLLPGTAVKVKRMLDLCSERGVEVLVYCTLRDDREQARLYRQGRPLSEIEAKATELEKLWQRPDLAKLLMDVGPQIGPLVTNAGPGQSMHGYGMAVDGCPIRGGKPVWGTTDPDDARLWEIYGACAVESGLVWAGHWSRFKEYPHVQEAGQNWRDLIRQGA